MGVSMVAIHTGFPLIPMPQHTPTQLLSIPTVRRISLPISRRMATVPASASDLVTATTRFMEVISADTAITGADTAAITAVDTMAAIMAITVVIIDSN